MGQSTNCQAVPSKEYVLTRQLPNGSIVQDHCTGQLHFLKEYSFTNQEAYQQAFVNFSKRLPDKHQHILYLERTNTKLENTFCSTFYKISLLYEYLDHTLQKEIEERNQQRKVFDEKEVWSVLCSCVLGVSEMIRVEGRSHSALSTKDIRLNEEGLVKILSLEMIGMSSDHDPNREGTTKQLAITVLNCLLMEEITNHSDDFLGEVIENLESTVEMKNILRLMTNTSTKFVELEEYLFRMVQEETDSLNSYTNTPNLKDNYPKPDNTYSKIPQESKEEHILMTMARDQEDEADHQHKQPQTTEEEVTDENDTLDDSKSRDSEAEYNQGTLRENSIPELSMRDSRTSNQLDNCTSKEGNCPSNQFNCTSKEVNSLFTDPKLLNLIHSDLEDIKKRKSIANSRNLGISDSKFSLQQNKLPLQQKQDSLILQTHYFNLNANAANANAPESKEGQSPLSYGSNENKPSHLGSASSDPPIASNKENNSLKSSQVTINNNYDPMASKISVNLRSQIEQQTWKSQKEIADLCSNPEKKLIERRVDNIMDMEDMGFKKTKAAKSKEEPLRTGVNSLKETANNDERMPGQAYLLEKSRQSHQQQRHQHQRYQQQPQKSRVQAKNELEYVTENYIRGRYEGTKSQNLRHGKGVFYYNEGGKYVGEWKENKMYGKGVLYYPNNEIAYDGEWRNDQLEGRGTLYNEEVIQLSQPFDFNDWDYVEDYWIKYEGQFSEDSKNGEGKLYLSNGEIFEGRFKDDMVWGEGVINRREGTCVKGLWRENKLMRTY